MKVDMIQTVMMICLVFFSSALYFFEVKCSRS